MEYRVKTKNSPKYVSKLRAIEQAKFTITKQAKLTTTNQAIFTTTDEAKFTKNIKQTKFPIKHFLYSRYRYNIFFVLLEEFKKSAGDNA